MKTYASLLVGLGLVMILGGPAFAQQSDLDAALAGMQAGKGDDYVAARSKLVALGDSARTTLESRLASASWSDDSWNALAVATIAHAQLAHPDVVKRVSHLEGLDPTVYLKRRRPEPECARELKRLGADAAGPLLELYLKTFESYPFTTAKTLPAGAPATAETLAQQERTALRMGIATALAEAKHPAAFYVCRAIARDANEVQGPRLQAAEGLGTLATAPALAELRSIHDDPATPAEVRLATIRGAARVASSDALTFLQQRLASDSADERRQAVYALGALGSYLGWQSRGPAVAKQGDDLRKAAASTLVDALRTGKPSVPGDALVDALGTIAHPDSKAQLEAASTDEKLSETARSLAKHALDRVNGSLARQAR